MAILSLGAIELMRYCRDVHLKRQPLLDQPAGLWEDLPTIRVRRGLGHFLL